MKLTELIVAIAIFLIASGVFTASLINVRRAVVRSEDASRKAVVLLETDALIRKEIQKISIPYWRSFESDFEKEKVSFEERLKIYGADKGFEITDIRAVYDNNKQAEGIKVIWKFCGKEYMCQEFIKQRINNGE